MDTHLARNAEWTSGVQPYRVEVRIISAQLL